MPCSRQYGISCVSAVRSPRWYRIWLHAIGSGSRAGRASSHARIVPAYVALDGSTLETRNSCSRGKPAIASPANRSAAPSPYISALSTCTIPSSMPRRSARFASSARAPLVGTFQVPWPTIGTSRPVAPNGWVITRSVTPSWQKILRHRGVLGGQPRLADERPLHADTGIAPAHRTFALRVVRHAVLVVHDRVVVEREKAVAEARGDEELPVVTVGEVEAFPPQVRRRLAPQVDDDVPDASVQALHELGHAKVVMQPADHVARRPRARVLREVHFESERGVFRIGPRLLEEAAVVFEHVGDEHARVGERRRKDLDHVGFAF